MVVNSEDKKIVKNSLIYINEEKFTCKTGKLLLQLRKGTYVIKASAAGYQITTLKLTLPLNGEELSLSIKPMIKENFLLYTFLWIMSKFPNFLWKFHLSI